MKKYQSINIIVVLLFVSIFTGSSTGRKKSRYHLVLSTWMGIWNKGRFQYWWDFTITSTKRNP